MTGQPLSKQMVFENEDNHFDVKMYGVTQVWRMIRKGNPNFIETFMEQPLAINEADPFMLTLDESQTIAKILHYNLPQFFKSCLGMANGTLKRKNATIKDYLQAIKNLDELCNIADIIVSCVGKPDLVKTCKHGAVLIDDGVSLVKGHQHGDISKCCWDNALAYTPWVGATGKATVHCLFENLYKNEKKIEDWC